MENPYVPFFWGVVSLFVGGLIAETDTVLGYIFGIPVLLLGFLSLRHLGQRLVFISSFKMLAICMAFLLGMIYLGDKVQSFYLSYFILSFVAAMWITCGIQVYYKKIVLKI